eukprot:scpid17430/ scgid26732/ Histone RNA hairpin-binding protein; Histone stem-loop-binding protein
MEDIALDTAMALDTAIGQRKSWYEMSLEGISDEDNDGLDGMCALTSPSPRPEEESPPLLPPVRSSVDHPRERESRSATCSHTGRWRAPGDAATTGIASASTPRRSPPGQQSPPTHREARTHSHASPTVQQPYPSAAGNLTPSTHTPPPRMRYSPCLTHADRAPPYRPYSPGERACRSQRNTATDRDNGRDHNYTEKAIPKRSTRLRRAVSLTPTANKSGVGNPPRQRAKDGRAGVNNGRSRNKENHPHTPHGSKPTPSPTARQRPPLTPKENQRSHPMPDKCLSAERFGRISGTCSWAKVVATNVDTDKAKCTAVTAATPAARKPAKAHLDFSSQTVTKGARETTPFSKSRGRLAKEKEQETHTPQEHHQMKTDRLVVHDEKSAEAAHQPIIPAQVDGIQISTQTASDNIEKQTCIAQRTARGGTANAGGASRDAAGGAPEISAAGDHAGLLNDGTLSLGPLVPGDICLPALHQHTYDSSDWEDGQVQHNIPQFCSTPTEKETSGGPTQQRPGTPISLDRELNKEEVMLDTISPVINQGKEQSDSSLDAVFNSLHPIPSPCRTERTEQPAAAQSKPTRLASPQDVVAQTQPSQDTTHDCTVPAGTVSNATGLKKGQHIHTHPHAQATSDAGRSDEPSKDDPQPGTTITTEHRDTPMDLEKPGDDIGQGMDNATAATATAGDAMSSHTLIEETDRTMDFETSTYGESSATRSWYDMVVEEEDHFDRDAQLPESTYPIIPRQSNEEIRPSSLDFEFTQSEKDQCQPLTSTPRRSHHNSRRRNTSNSRQSTPSSSRRDHHKENVSPVSDQSSPHGVRRSRRDQRPRSSGGRNSGHSRGDTTPNRGSRSPLRRPLGERQSPAPSRKTSDSWAQLVAGVSPKSHPVRATPILPSSSADVGLERNLDKEFSSTSVDEREQGPASLNDTLSELDLSYGFEDSMCLTDDISFSARTSTPSGSVPSTSGLDSPRSRSRSPASVPSASLPTRRATATLKRSTSEPGDIESGHRSSKRPCYLPTLDDPHRLAQRQKQIDFGKNTIGYDIYTSTVTRSERGPGMPRTPDKRLNCSKRQFDGLLKSWRRQLHTYDPDYTVKTGSQSFADLSDSALGQSVLTEASLSPSSSPTKCPGSPSAAKKLRDLDFSLDAGVSQSMLSA